MSEHRKSLPRVFFATRASPCTPASFISARLWFQLNEHILNSDLPLFRQWTPARHHLRDTTCCTSARTQHSSSRHTHTSTPQRLHTSAQTDPGFPSGTAQLCCPPRDRSSLRTGNRERISSSARRFCQKHGTALLLPAILRHPARAALPFPPARGS